MEFALTLVEELEGKELAKEVAGQLLFNYKVKE